MIKNPHPSEPPHIPARDHVRSAAVSSGPLERRCWYTSNTSRVSINMHPVYMDMYFLFPYLLPVHIAGTICREGMYGDPVGHM